MVDAPAKRSNMSGTMRGSIVRMPGRRGGLQTATLGQQMQRSALADSWQNLERVRERNKGGKQRLMLPYDHTKVLMHSGGVGGDVQWRKACLRGAPGRRASVQVVFQQQLLETKA